MNNDKKASKARRNKRYYEKTKGDTDAVLLRLQQGSRTLIDDMAQSFGVARSALFDLYLLPFCEALSQHQGALQQLAMHSGCSVSALLGRLISQAQAQLPKQEAAAAPSPDVGLDFDAFFDVPNEEP